MKTFAVGLILVFSLVLLSHISLAAPFLHTPRPANNTFVSGGAQTFSINVTSANLNSNSALLYIISLNAYEQGEIWDAHNLTCVNTSSEWKCTKSISFAIAGSDTIELFYFEANDTDNTKGNNGTVSNPLRFTLDRNQPLINFVNPANNSYVNGNESISLTVTDSSSGVNNNTVQYSTDGSSWATLRNVSTSSFEAVWNTTTISNNQTVALYARASDNVGNNVTTKINVTADNEMPQIVAAPLAGILSGNAQLQVNVSDGYSGVDLGKVRYSVGSLSGTLGCTGSIYSAACSAVMNTASLQDGNYTINFTVTDRADNSNTSLVNITTKNTQPSISITSPANNALIKETILVNTTLANAKDIVKYVEVSVEQGGNTTTRNMTCNSDFTICSYSLNTLSFVDGGASIKAKAINTLNSDISTSITVSFDNTKPKVDILQPGADVKGDFEIKADVTDANLNLKGVSFNISSFNGSLTCTLQTPSRSICSTTFNSKQLTDGRYALNISAEDKAGNLAAASKEITATNQLTGSPSLTGGGGGVSGSASESSQVNNNATTEQGEEKKIFIQIYLPFKGEYIMLGVVLTTVIIVVIILAVVVGQRLNKTIITGE